MNTNKQQIKSAVRLHDVTNAELGQRLDNFLLKIFKNVPRTRIYRIIRKGEVRINKKRCKPDYKLKLGDQIRVPPIRNDQNPDQAAIISDSWLRQIEASILYENKHLIIIDKPSGLAVHSGSGVDYGVIDIMRKLRPESDMELVHRLDRDTSGCLLLAKNRQALLALQRCVMDDSLNKIYLAVVKGIWPENKVEIKHSLKKMTMTNGERRVFVDSGGQKAFTRILQAEPGKLFSLLTIQLLTGRTHQIRVHCQAEGHEIAGDNKYGDREFNRNMKKLGIKRLMLHASRLELPKTDFNDEIVVNATPPQHFSIGIHSNG